MIQHTVVSCRCRGWQLIRMRLLITVQTPQYRCLPHNSNRRASCEHGQASPRLAPASVTWDKLHELDSTLAIVQSGHFSSRTNLAGQLTCLVCTSECCRRVASALRLLAR